MIGKDIRHDSGISHVTGESRFIDDRPIQLNEVHIGLILSPVANGKLNSINWDLAKEHKDYVGHWTSKDTAAKKWGPIVHDQPILVDEKISYMDEVLAVFACNDKASILEIQKLVEVSVQEDPAIFSISKAKIAGNIISKSPKPFSQGDVNKALKNSQHKLKGTFKCGGQEHFYMESQACVAYPMEQGQIELHCSSQHPSETQRIVAEALGIPFHQVVCIVKRMGGGFGGKETQAAPIAAYAAMAAYHLQRPARLILTKDDDMKITGKRHPFENEYEVGFDDNGKILGLKVLLQSDGGAYSDLSSSILERGMFHTDGAYYLENCQIEGICYRTNNHSNTAYRGFGGPQGNMTIESIFEDISVFLKKDSFEIRNLNKYEGENQKTPYGQPFTNNMLPKLFNELFEMSDYEKRLEEIREYNSKGFGKVKGLSMTATKFGIAFTAKFLNQANAIVNMHLDGTLQISTGATEMGQGVNTKLQQIAANSFGIDYTAVQVMTTSTEKNHNTSATAASSGSDINGEATLKACNKIKAKLTSLASMYFSGKIDVHYSELEEYEVGKGQLDEDIAFKNGEVIQISTNKMIELKDLVMIAYLNRVSLGARAHYKTPGLGFSKEEVKGKAFNYFTQGTALTEVSVCEYTGETKVLRTDIYMDLGRSLNPGIDLGQVTGAYVQAMGWVTAEQLTYAESGKLLTHSPTTYKIPNIQDTPREFKVDFITNEDNDCNIHGSKAVGEPPFVLGISVWTAIKNALSYRSKDEIVQLTSPATNEVVLNELTRLKYGKKFK